VLKDAAVNNVGYILYVHEQIKLDIMITCRTELKDTKSYMYFHIIIKNSVKVLIESTQSSQNTHNCTPQT